MPRPIVPPLVREEGGSLEDSKSRPSLTPGEIIAHPAKEDPAMTQRVDAFLKVYDGLSKDQKIARAKVLKTSDPKLFTAVQVRLARRNTQEARERIDASQTSRDQMREVDKTIVKQQNGTAGQARAALVKPPKTA